MNNKMRQSITTTLFAVLLSMVGINAFGHDIEVKNADGVTIYYKWINNNKLEVSYRGSDYSSYSNNSNKYTGNVVIPESVNINGNTYPVTSIGEFAFQNCYGLTSVTIPNSVTSIGESTFRRCSGLTSVTIPNSVSSIGHNAFDGCSGLTSVTIPNSVSSIGYNAFFGTAWYNNQPDGLVYAGKVVYKYKGEMPANTHITIKNGTQGIAISAFDGCSGLTSVTIPNSVTSIGVHAFDGTAWYNNQPNGLVYAGKVAYDYKGEMPANTKITLKDGTLVIAENAFYNCTGLISVTIPNSVTSIGDWAFNGCIGLTSVTIPNSVTFIGRSAFNGCSGMASVFIPSSVTSIGGNAFYGCSALTSIKVESDNQTYDSRNNCNAIIEKSTNTLIAGCKNTIIPNSVTSIGDWVFNGCIGLTSVTIPNSVTSIGRSAFNGCSGLTSITIPNSVTSIGDYAFAYCSGLTSITIPNSITSIGKDAFSSCSGLKTIYSELKTPIQIAYSEYNKYAEDYIYLYPFSDDNFSNTILYVPKDTKSTYLATAGWNKFTNIFEVGEVGSIFEVDGIYYVIGQDNTVSVISGKTKYSGDVVIPSQVTCLGATYSVNSIEEEAFIGCSGLTSVTIPNSVTSIGFGAFIGCTSLVSVTIPSSMTFIDRATFEGCSSLASVTIPNSVRHIGGSAFSGTAWLKNQPDGLIYAGKLAYTYKGEMPANTHITLENGTLGINIFAFRNCSGLTSITIPNSVTSIGQNAFSGCRGLTSVTIPNSVTFIGVYAFSDCSGLTSVIVGKGVQSISNDLFYDCNNLQEMILSQAAYEHGIPASVTKFTTYSKNPMRVVVTSKGATSAILKIYPIDDSGNTNEDNYSTVTMLGLTPGQYIKWKLDDENYGIISEKTTDLTLATQPAQPTSTTKARLTATVNDVDDDKHFGFEWLRNDAPSNMPANKVSAPLYEGKIIGSLSGLNPDIYYKYRPYYQSDNGETYYGEWLAFLTGDADVFFEPETHTKDVAEVTSVSAQLAGVWIEGTEDIEEKGFEYWINSSGNTRAIGKDVKKVIVNGNMTTVVLEDLAIGTEYGYRSYMKTASCTTYGEEKTFKTSETAIDTDDVEGDVNGDGVVDDADLKDVVSHIMGNTPIGFNKNAADVNNDNKVNAADIVLINKIINKK